MTTYYRVHGFISDNCSNLWWHGSHAQKTDGIFIKFKGHLSLMWFWWLFVSKKTTNWNDECCDVTMFYCITRQLIVHIILIVNKNSEYDWALLHLRIVESLFCRQRTIKISWHLSYLLEYNSWVLWKSYFWDQIKYFADYGHCS